jgi:hypothetical protein
MQWQYEKPGNDAQKPLTTEAGYEAMVMSLEGPKKDFVIFVSMPIPYKDSNVCFFSLSQFTEMILNVDTAYRLGILMKAIVS